MSLVLQFGVCPTSNSFRPTDNHPTRSNQSVDTRQAQRVANGNSTPFLVDAPISRQNREEAEKIVADVSLASLFNHCPTLATWAVLTPLAQHYGDKTLDVYAHISRFVREDFSDPVSRGALKWRYRQAARKLGLPVSGTHPTELFSPLLGQRGPNT